MGGDGNWHGKLVGRGSWARPKWCCDVQRISVAEMMCGVLVFGCGSERGLKLRKGKKMAGRRLAKGEGACHCGSMQRFLLFKKKSQNPIDNCKSIMVLFAVAG